MGAISARKNTIKQVRCQDRLLDFFFIIIISMQQKGSSSYLRRCIKQGKIRSRIEMFCFRLFYLI